MKNINRRQFLAGAAGVSLTALLSTKGYAMFGFGESKNDQENFPFQLSDEEWRERLSSKSFNVLREHGTERSGTSPLNDEKRSGIYHCAGCDQKLFSSDQKFDSGTGWPSFYQPIDGVDSSLVGERQDNTLFMARTEVHCTNCGGHQGHVFPDGPKPTGLRYCINGVALNFKPN
jgi:peptide-methionine (R)-S-oxide reductase